MVRQLVLAGLLLFATATQALANGRPAATSTINFRQGMEQHIAAGMTFGLVVSKDGGATWHWICEDAVQYGGMYDPDYTYTSSGALFATTFVGALVNRDGCAFDASTFGMKFVSSMSQGPTGHIFLGTVHPADPAAMDPGDSKIYKSTDNGMTFPTSAMPAAVGIWWNSVEAAPTNANKIYASGYRLITMGRVFELYRSDNGGTSYTPLTTNGITTSANSTIDIVGISPLNPDHVYVRVTYQNPNAIGDGIYRSTNGGMSWTRIRNDQDELAFLVRANGDLVVGGRQSGLHVSRSPSNGAAWEDLANAPHVNCLVENAAGEVWACTQNFGSPGVMSDGAGIMKSTTLATWTPVLKYQDIAGPLDCAAGTLQHDKCVAASPSPWCGLRAQFGISADPTTCPALFDAPEDGGGGDVTVKPPKGCCDTGGGGSLTGLAFALVVGTVVLRPRRRRCR
jgi:photosystem II stability/assembly factor-like uncharacterized protein